MLGPWPLELLGDVKYPLSPPFPPSLYHLYGAGVTTLHPLPPSEFLILCFCVLLYPVIVVRWPWLISKVPINEIRIIILDSSGWRGAVFANPSIWSNCAGMLRPTWVYPKQPWSRPWSTHRWDSSTLEERDIFYVATSPFSVPNMSLHIRWSTASSWRESRTWESRPPTSPSWLDAWPNCTR